jgi:cytochrome c553
MKPIALRQLAPMIMLTLICASSGRAENSDQTTLSPQDLQTKLVYCKTCHGMAGQGYRGSSPMPRLAGQHAEYLESQLSAFVEGRRKSNFMSRVASTLSPAMVTAVSKHFSALDPKPLGGAASELAVIGKSLYERGVPGTDIRPCAACHGLDGKGDGASPRLAGQLPDYTFKTLVNWSKERGQDPKKPDTSSIMEPIAHRSADVRACSISRWFGIGRSTLTMAWTLTNRHRGGKERPGGSLGLVRTQN